MDRQAIVIYCICDEALKAIHFEDDPQVKMTTAEVMTFAFLAAIHFYGDYRKTRLICHYQRYFGGLLSLGRLVRRIHRIPEDTWWQVFRILQICSAPQEAKGFIVDSFPIKTYENHKSFRAKIFSGKKFHGYSASRKQYFFGLKVHMIIDINGVPVEFCLTPGSVSDISGLRRLPTNLPPGSLLFADKAYTDYGLEDCLKEVAGVDLLAARRKNLRRQHSTVREFILRQSRNQIETVFSSITSRMPRTIRARTERGFCLKIFFFIIAYMINLRFPEGCRSL